MCLNLFEAFRGRTVFFITHRLGHRAASGHDRADGSGGGDGPWETMPTLMQRQGWYYGLAPESAPGGVS